MAGAKQQRSQASYEALIEAAAREFHARGYAATSVDDIVRETPYSRGSFYFHFTNKLHCFLEVIAHRGTLRSGWADLPARYDRRTTPLVAILREASQTLSRSLGGRDRWVLLMVECYQQTRGDEEARQRLREAYPPWLAELTTFVEGLQAGGWVDPHQNARVLAARIFAFTEGLSVHEALYGLDRAAVREAAAGGMLALLPPPPVED